MSLRPLYARLKRLEEQVGAMPKPAWNLTTEAEILARVQELDPKWWSDPRSEKITVAEWRDIKYLTKHYPQYVPPVDRFSDAGFDYYRRFPRPGPNPFADVFEAFRRVAEGEADCDPDEDS
jgi:hypothetical protein